MEKSFVDVAIGGALAGGFIWITVLLVGWLWRLLRTAFRAVPKSVEQIASVAGTATAKAERAASQAASAFKEARNRAKK